MSTLKLKELSKLGYTNDTARSLAVTLISKHFKHHTKSELITLLTRLKQDPDAFVQDPVLGPLAFALTGRSRETTFQAYELRTQPGPLKVYGGKDIEPSAKRQMELALTLPVAVQGALMPDAHTGYGLPIGGVLAAANAVIPYAVGVDIGCRMALTLFAENGQHLAYHAYALKDALRRWTHFGMEGGLEERQEHPVLDSPLFRETDWLRQLQGKAVRQLGTSGSGNHFVDWGTLELYAGNSLSLPPGNYLALLSHSGSRGLGASIAQRFTRMAMDSCRLPKAAQSLAWLGLDTEAGQEYWMGMTLAGDYAQACHQIIHRNLARATGLQPLATVENHHNFAWKEVTAEGQEVIVHRKGATPAHAGELGIIPGSMTSPAYLVRGKGVGEALYSAAHGAGRAMSRQRAKEQLTASALKKLLSAAGVTLIGGSTEEAPPAYKDIDRVLAAQEALVDVEGKFMPKIVRMNKD